MKITGQYPNKAAELNSGKTREMEKQAGKASGTEKNEAQGPVRTEGARITTRLREAVEAVPDIRMDRVAELRAKLAKGEFRVDAERLADSMLRETLREDVE